MIARLKHLFNLNNAVLLGALLLMVSWAMGTVDAIQKNFSLQQEVDSLVQQNALASLQNDTLKFQQKYLTTHEYLELSARERLNKASAGEHLVNLPSATIRAKPLPSTAPVLKPLSQRSNAEQWMYFLFGDKSRQP